MGYEKGVRRSRRSAVRRAWVFCFLLALPALAFTGFLFYQQQISFAPALLIIACLLLYLALVAAALEEGGIGDGQAQELEPFRAFGEGGESFAHGRQIVRGQPAGRDPGDGTVGGAVPVGHLGGHFR